MGDDIDSGLDLRVRLAVVEVQLQDVKNDVQDVRNDIKSIRTDQRATLFAVVTQLVALLATVVWWVVTHPNLTVGHP